MIGKQRGPAATSESTPSQPLDVPSPIPPTYEPSHVIQLLVMMQGEIKGLCTKTDRLISDVEKLDGHVGRLNTTYNRAWGFGICGIM